MCAAEVLTMAGVFAFPALLPIFVAQWALTNTEAGWIAGIYFAAYAASVPLLMALTDRIDARVVYVAGALLAAASAAGFALVAAGFWTAMVLRALAGIGLAATFMPGLKVLVDRYRGTNQSRAVAFYTSSFSLGTAASFLLAGELAAAVNWRLAFAAAAAAAGAAAALMALAIAPTSGPRASSISARLSPTARRWATCWVTESIAGSCSRCDRGWWRSLPLPWQPIREQKVGGRRRRR
jgi:MFS family permease